MVLTTLPEADRRNIESVGDRFRFSGSSSLHPERGEFDAPYPEAVAIALDARRRLLASAQNSTLHDERIAEFAGMTAEQIRANLLLENEIDWGVVQMKRSATQPNAEK